MEKVGKILGDSLRGRRFNTASPSSIGGSDRCRVVSRARVVERFGGPLQASGEEACGDPQGESEGAGPQDAEKRRPGSYYPQRRKRLGVQTDLTKVKSIISRVLANRGLDKKVERYEFILRWHEIVGERLAEVSKPEYIRNRALIVRVLHPAWAQELTMIKPILLESLAKFLKPGDVVTDMIFRVDVIGTNVR